MGRWSLCAAVFLVVTVPMPGQPLPRVTDVDWGALRADTERLLKGLEDRKAALPAEAMRKLRAVLVEKPEDVAEAIKQVQEILDAHCLAGVSINPESRVKAARGAARAELTRGEPVYRLIKIDNDAGVTHPLAIDGDELVRGKPGLGRWLEVEVDNKEPLSHKLHGRRLQYVVVRLTAHESGKREATLRFDVGQGTQDLGFRAEVPILFNVRK